MPRATVVMVIGTATQYLEEAFKSLAAQTLQDFQLLICTNSETTPPNLPSGGDIQVIHDGLVKDLAIRYNELLDQAKTDLIIPIDPEDVHNKNKVKFLVELMEDPKNSFLSATGVEARIIDDKGEDTRGWHWIAESPQQSLDWCKISKPSLIHGSSIYRKFQVQEVGGYNPRWKVIFDVDLYSQLTINGYLVMGVPGIKVRYTDYRKTMTKVIANRKGLVEERIAMRDVHRELNTWENWQGYTKIPQSK